VGFSLSLAFLAASYGLHRTYRERARIAWRVWGA
jgi:hypothetical protein